MIALSNTKAITKDDRLLTGRGQYVHDTGLRGMLHAVFVRSVHVHAHARLLAVDVAAASACEGVVAVLDASHLAGRTMPPINALVEGTQAPEFPLLASGQVDSVGQPIAVAVASSPQAAQDAAEQVVLIDYAALPALPDLNADAQDVAVVRHKPGDPQATAALAAQAMMEQIVYNDEGQPVTGSLMDFAVPRAADMPPVEIETIAVATPANLLGAKGVDEAGCIGVPAALLNAAADALSPLGKLGESGKLGKGEIDLDFPLKSERLGWAIQQWSA